MSRINLYVSNSSNLCQVVTWLCRSVEIRYNEHTVNSVQDMTEIIERNPNKCLPVLQDSDIFLTEGTAILKYLSEIANKYGNTNKWPGLAWPEDFKERAKIEELLSYCQSFLKPSIQDYMTSQQAAIYDSVPDTSKADKLQSVLQDLDYKKKRHQFLVNDHLTIADLMVFSCIYPLFARSSQQHP